MQLHLSRSQKSGLMGGVKFQLTAQVELTGDEHAFVKKYKMSDTMLYEKGSEKVLNAGSTLGILAARFQQITVTVGDLLGGKTIEGKDILEIMAAQEQIKEACQGFHAMLQSAASFEGEEVLHFT